MSGASVQTEVVQSQTNGVKAESVVSIQPPASKPSDTKPKAEAKVSKESTEDADPYLALFSAIKGNDEEMVDADEAETIENGDNEELDAEAGATVEDEDAVETSTNANIAHRPTTRAESAKDITDTSYYSTIKNRTWGAVQAIGRLFAGPRPGSEMGSEEPEGVNGERSPSPVAKRTRSARAKGDVTLEGEEESEHGSPPRKRTRQSVISSRS